ncbi:Fbox domain containing protein [Acanthamoeba castellanii str. Neff]|uniref:Fbox domain containing protein n=1 Tax=Acanthamoeba castellanii (strain ATCC 30010 / Neff) TaxID=1257118 RepID=L8GRP9_ACACF|nr:Fbox domain containing protein [Acanthamoeba castellanii str. Neff]ELR15318.1 Fbox domain containing protein [Acanthamoeba castellanii str. Neff]
MEQLPDELCLHILRYVSLEDLTLRCSATSRALRRISDDADLWHHHLDRYHPRWRDALQRMGVDATVTPLRECVRCLTEAHDPDGKSGCCRHDLTKGAACTCCTCRRHHRPGQRWQWGVLSSLVNDIDDDMRQMIAAAYDANAATSLQLIGDDDDDERRRQRRRRRLKRRRGQRRRYGGGGGGGDDDDDCDRRRELITELERMGILELRNKDGRLESVRWTEAAHRDLRPPLQRGLVCYTDAELHANLMRHHPELCDDTAPSTGSTAPSTSLFGATTSTYTSRSSLFGGGGTSSLFGGAGTGAATASTSLFGATTPSKGGGLFGAPAASTGTIGGGLFGGSSRFGSTPSTPSATTSGGFPSLGGFSAGTTSTFSAPAASTGSSRFGPTPSTPSATTSSSFPSLGGFSAGTTSTGSSRFGPTPAPATSTGSSRFGPAPSTPSATSGGFPSLGGFSAGTTSAFSAPAASTSSSRFGPTPSTPSATTSGGFPSLGGFGAGTTSTASPLASASAPNE